MATSQPLEAPPVNFLTSQPLEAPPSKVEETEEVESSSDDDDPFTEIDSDSDVDFEDPFPPEYYERIGVLMKIARRDYEADGDKIPYGRPVLQLHEDCSRLLRINLGYLSVFALQKYNRDNQANYKFVRVVKACVRRCAGSIYFITFEAVDAPSDFQTFQAQVWNGIGKDRVNLCRLKTTDVRNLPSFGKSETDHRYVDFHQTEADKDVFFDFDLDPEDHMRDVTILNLETDALNLQTDAYYIVSHFAIIAVHQFNWRRTTHGSYWFVKVVKAMMRDNKYYITFEAEDRNSDEEGAKIKIFRALVWYKEGNWKTISIRLKPAN